MQSESCAQLCQQTISGNIIASADAITTDKCARRGALWQRRRPAHHTPRTIHQQWHSAKKRQSQCRKNSAPCQALRLPTSRQLTSRADAPPWAREAPCGASFPGSPRAKAHSPLPNVLSYMPNIYMPQGTKCVPNGFSDDDPIHGCRIGPNVLFCTPSIYMPQGTKCVPNGFSDDDPINGCRIGTQCPILHAKRGQVCPVGFGDEASTEAPRPPRASAAHIREAHADERRREADREQLGPVAHQRTAALAHAPGLATGHGQLTAQSRQVTRSSQIWT
jgi:hypothetical protein